MPEIREAPAGAKRIGPLELFLVFSHLSSQGFGGVMAFAYRMLVEKKRWLSNAEFAELFALAQILPGPPVLHMAMILGHRNAGLWGGMSAVFGIVAIPTVFVVGLGFVYQHFSDVEVFRRTLAGISMAAAALILVMGIKLAKALPMHWRAWALFALAFILLAFSHMPFFVVVPLMLPVAVAVYWGMKEKS